MKTIDHKIKKSYINDKTVDFRIEPFIKEVKLMVAMHMICIAIPSVVLIIITIHLDAEFPSSMFFPMLSGVIAWLLAFSYRVFFQMMIDMRKKDYITEIVGIEWRFVEEGRFHGGAGGDPHHSMVYYCYPKIMEVERYKIKVLNNHVKKKKLRTIMSGYGLMHKVQSLQDNQIEYLKVMYLKRSKILLLVQLAEEIDKNMDMRKRKDILKTLTSINNTI